MEAGFPRYFVLESSINNKYLRYKQQRGAFEGLVYFDGSEVISPFSKFELVPSESEDNDGLFHIRCCFRNKYLTNVKESTATDDFMDDDTPLISEMADGVPDAPLINMASSGAFTVDTKLYATAGKAVEDQTLETCTLFEPKFDQDNKKSVRLRHVKSNKYVALNPRTYTLNVGNGVKPSFSTRFSIIDWETLVILPKTVLFKGHNDCYLGIHEQDESRAYLKLDITDRASDLASHEVFYNGDGTVRIKSDYTGMFWRRSPNWIWPDSTDTTSDDLDTVFRLERGNGDNEVRLVNLGNNKYCSPLTAEGKAECLNAHVSSIEKEATFTVEEPVKERTIYNVNFHRKDETLYEDTDVAMITRIVNNPSNVEDKEKVSHEFKAERTSTWTHGDSFKCGVEATITAAVPGIGKAGITLSAAAEKTFTWGTTQTDSETIKTSDEIPVPANSTVTISVVVTKGRCDVPFSYTRKDVFFSGKAPVTERMHDGKFTGTRCYNCIVNVKAISNNI